MRQSGSRFSRNSCERKFRAFAGVLALALATGCIKTPDRYAASTLDVKVNPAATFELEGEPFCFGGSNNYYPLFKPRHVVDDLFNAARDLDFRVMRVWAMMDRGSFDGTVPNSDPDGPEKEGVYFQYWDTEKKAPAYNDGPNGLERLDYVLASAERANVKVSMVLVNNWRAFGGIDQYLMWYGRDKHHEFFSEPELRQAYKNWAQHLIMRKNTITGRLYRDDPTIFAWGLANEPRCKGGAAFDRSTGWTNDTLTNWVDEMSRYIKSLDPNHMVSVGDEGFLNGGGEHWAYKANDGVDHAAITALPAIDYGTFHMYVDQWGGTPEWGEKWIVDHLKVARSLGKPTVLEEFGLRVTRKNDKLGPIVSGWPERERAYTRWNEIMLRRGGNGSLSWMLSGIDNDLPRYPDYDHYGYYKDDETGILLGDYAKRFKTAPACESALPGDGTKSPFVRVRKPKEQVAVGWLESKG
jgi:mannan endo-1,4-beta-mannosidase